VNPKAFQESEKEKLPPDVSNEKGTLVEARNPEGMSMLVKIVEVKEKTVVIDFNHPLAGKELEFQIEVLGVK
jgi:FKBP-type peptidyl-prolyl cis-trans isomerase 2